jgi:hypothetical protein
MMTYQEGCDCESCSFARGDWHNPGDLLRITELQSKLDLTEKAFAAARQVAHDYEDKLDEREKRLAAIRRFIDEAVKADGIGVMRGWLINLIENFMHWEREDGRVVERQETK